MRPPRAANTPADTFEPQEVAWRLPGVQGWKRRVCRTEAALDRLLATLPGDAEVLTRKAD